MIEYGIIKKIVELADGFDWEIEETGTEIVGCPDGGIISIFEMEAERANFPLLIRRAVDGFNRNYSDKFRSIDTDETGIYLSRDKCNSKAWPYPFLKPTDILTVEEVCLLEALKEVLI